MDNTCKKLLLLRSYCVNYPVIAAMNYSLNNIIVICCSDRAILKELPFLISKHPIIFSYSDNAKKISEGINYGNSRGVFIYVNTEIKSNERIEEHYIYGADKGAVFILTSSLGYIKHFKKNTVIIIESQCDLNMIRTCNYIPEIDDIKAVIKQENILKAELDDDVKTAFTVSALFLKRYLGNLASTELIKYVDNFVFEIRSIADNTIINRILSHLITIIKNLDKTGDFETYSSLPDEEKFKKIYLDFGENEILFPEILWKNEFRSILAEGGYSFSMSKLKESGIIICESSKTYTRKKYIRNGGKILRPRFITISIDAINKKSQKNILEDL